MKRVLLMLLICFLTVGLFAQTTFSVTNTVQARAQQMPGKDKTDLGRLREQVDLRINNQYINFWYRARFNFQDWTADDPGLGFAKGFLKSLVPGAGDAQANLLVMPVSAWTFGIGTDFGWDLGPFSLWDDDYYTAPVGDGATAEEIQTSFGDWTTKKFSGANGGRPSRVAVHGLATKVSIKGLELLASVPFQDFVSLKGKGDNFAMRWGAKYTMENVFSIGAGYSGTYNSADNGWGIYAGAKINAVDVVKPEIFYNYLNKGSKVTSGINGQHNVGFRVPVKVSKLTLDPEFAISINTLGKDTLEPIKDIYGKTLGTPVFVAVPIAFQINDLFAVNLWYSFASGGIKAVSDGTIGGYKSNVDMRNVIRPGVKLNTGAGIFDVQCAVILDTLQSRGKKTEVGYLLHLAWEKKF